MTIMTSRGKTFTVDWMCDSFPTPGSARLQMRDDRPIHAIAADFEGLDHIRRNSETEGDMDFVGYTELTSVIRSSGAVQLTLIRPESR